MISLKQLSAMDDAPCNKALKVRVLSSTTVQNYSNAAGQQRTMFSAVVADSSSFLTVKCYDVKHHSKFVADAGLMLLNTINHKTHLALTLKSIVALTDPPTVPPEIIAAASKPSSDAVTAIEEMLHSPSSTVSTIKGKVVQTTPTKVKEWAGNSCQLQVGSLF